MSAVSSGQPKLYDIGRELYHIAALDVPCDEAARHVILNMLLDVAPQRPRAKLRRVTATRHGLCQLRSNIYLHLPNEFGAGVAGSDDHSIGKTDGAAKHISKAAIIEHL